MYVEGKPIPSELRKEEGILRKQIQLDDALNDGSAAIPDIDDEYGRAGIDDPKIFLTTCRDPSTRLVQFAKVCQFCFCFVEKKKSKKKKTKQNQTTYSSLF